jgi:hypothetical protein
MKKEKL